MNRGSRNDQRLVSPASGFANRLVANLAAGGSPDKGAPFNAQTIRTAWSSRSLSEGNRPGFQASMTRTLGQDFRPVMQITVSDNDFSTGACLLKIGDYVFVAGVDYLVGALAANTATNLSAALDRIPGWNSTVVGADIQVSYPHPGRIRYEVRHLGTIANLTLAGPGGAAFERADLMSYSAIEPTPPIVTP